MQKPPDQDAVASARGLGVSEAAVLAHASPFATARSSRLNLLSLTAPYAFAMAIWPSHAVPLVNLHVARQIARLC